MRPLFRSAQVLSSRPDPVDAGFMARILGPGSEQKLRLSSPASQTGQADAKHPGYAPDREEAEATLALEGV